MLPSLSGLNRTFMAVVSVTGAEAEGETSAAGMGDEVDELNFHSGGMLLIYLCFLTKKARLDGLRSATLISTENE
jgi:hypothetical protein